MQLHDSIAVVLKIGTFQTAEGVNPCPFKESPIPSNSHGDG